jgi:hypothetical protein
VVLLKVPGQASMPIGQVAEAGLDGPAQRQRRKLFDHGIARRDLDNQVVPPGGVDPRADVDG